MACSICHRGGHNIATCPEVATSPKTPRITGSKSQSAALFVASNGGTLRDAAARFGVSHQAVHQAWMSLFPRRRPPVRAASADRRTTIEALARAGQTATQIAEEAGVSVSYVYIACKKAGIRLAGSRKRRFSSTMLDEAVAAVAAGERPAEVAVRFGLSWSYLKRLTQDRGVTCPISYSGARDGRTRRAVNRVLAGETIAQACAAEMTSPPSVSAALRRLRRNEEGPEILGESWDSDLGGLGSSG